MPSLTWISARMHGGERKYPWRWACPTSHREVRDFHYVSTSYFGFLSLETNPGTNWTHTATTQWPQKDSKWQTGMQFRKPPASNGCCCLSLMLMIVLLITCTSVPFQVELVFSRPLTPDLQEGMGCSWITEKVTTWMGDGNLRSVCANLLLFGTV